MKKLHNYLMVVLICTTSILGQVNLSEKEFKEALTEAVRKASNSPSHYEQQYLKDFKPIKGFNYLKSNVWEILGTAALQAQSSSSVSTLTKKVQVYNYGTYFEVHATSQAIPNDYMEAIEKVSYIENVLEYFVDDYEEELTVQFNRQKGYYSLFAKHTYVEKDLDDIAEYLFEVIHVFRSMPRNFAFALADVEEDYLDNLESADLKPLSNFSFVILMKDNSLNEVKKEAEGTLGFWQFSKDETNLWYEIYNYEDRLEYDLSRELAEGVSDEDKKAFVAKLQEYLDDEGMKYSSSLKAGLSDDGGYLMVTATFKYDGSIEGEDLRDAYNDIWESWSHDLADEINEITGVD